MSKFTNSLKIEILPKSRRYPYRVTENMECHSGDFDSGLFVRCELGFEFDGTSIPWYARWIISPSDPELLQCSAIHDKGYRTGYMLVRVEGIEKKIAVSRSMMDSLYWQAMVATNVKPWKRKVINKALKFGGEKAWNYWGKNGAMRTETTQ